MTEGQRVERGQVVANLESMKLLAPLSASVAGTITALDCRQGDNVRPGHRLMRIELLAEESAAGRPILPRFAGEDPHPIRTRP